MKLYIGIDLGTSAMKLLLMDAEGTIYNTVTKEYPLEFPQPGWSQQNPEDWKKALLEGTWSEKEYKEHTIKMEITTGTRLYLWLHYWKKYLVLSGPCFN